MDMDMDMSHKTGYFSGHAIAGSGESSLRRDCSLTFIHLTNTRSFFQLSLGFLLFGFFILSLTLKRVRSLPYDVTFDQVYIPERNSSVLLGGGLVIILVTMFGVCFEAPGWDNIIAPLTHVSLYLTFMLVGVTALLEGLKRLQQDSVRISIVFCMILHYIIWSEHAAMKEVSYKKAVIGKSIKSLCALIASIDNRFPLISDCMPSFRSFVLSQRRLLPIRSNTLIMSSHM